MGITKAKITQTLNDIFAVGNVIHLFKEVPDETTGYSGERITGASYKGHEIEDGDFVIEDNKVQSIDNIMFYLCEEEEGHGTAKGFGVFDNGTLVYFGEFKNPMPIAKDNIPTIKRYDGETGDGIQITLTCTESSASE